MPRLIYWCKRYRYCCCRRFYNYSDNKEAAILPLVESKSKILRKSIEQRGVVVTTFFEILHAGSSWVDPLSVAAGVAGLISLGPQTTDYLVKYYTAYCDRDDNLARIADQLGDPP